MTMAATLPDDSVWSQMTMRCYYSSLALHHTAAKIAGFGVQFCTKLCPKERCFSNTYRAIFFLWRNYGCNFSETSYYIRQALQLTTLFHA
jgi:hypothetical protein